MALNLAELEEELKREPKSRLFYDLAREYQKLGRLDEALVLCERGLSFHPSQWQSRILLAQLYLAKGRLENACEMVEKVLLPLPDNVPANHLAADIYRALGEKEKALRHFKIVELLEPGRTGVRDHITELSAGPETAPGPGASVVEEEIPRQPQEEPEVVRVESQDEEAPASTPETDVDSMFSPPVESLTAPEPGPAGSESEVDWAVDTAAFDRSILEDEKDTDAFDTILTQENEVATEGGVPPEGSESKAEWKPPEIEAEEGDEEDLPCGDADAEDRDDSAGMSTVTLAELYERQGYPEKAVEIYQRLLLRQPDDQAIHDKIDQLMKRLAGEAPEGPPVHQEDVERALRRKRVSVLQDWLRRVREGSHV